MNHKLIQLARPEIVTMRAYHSARSEQSANEIMPDKIWLDANENPGDDSQNIQYNRYPEPQPHALITCLSTLYDVKPEQLLITRGSDEGIDLLVRLFCEAGKDKIMICPPTYGMYKVAASIQNAGVIEVPLVTQDFSMNVISMLETWKPDIKIIFLCSPNNPTGNLQSTTDVLLLCEKLDGKSIVVMDEAYIEFSESDGLAKYIDNYSNLVVLRTLSKAFGLAGIRCGATIADCNIIQLLKKIIAPYPIPKPVVEIACRDLTRDNIQIKINMINQEKARLFAFMSKLPFVKKIFNSQANFLLVEVTNAKEIMKKCLTKNIVLRDRSNDFNLNNCIRITIGSPNENNFLMEVLADV